MTGSIILAYGLPIILLIAGSFAVYRITTDASAEKRRIDELRTELIENQKKLDDHYVSKAAETDKEESSFRWKPRSDVTDPTLPAILVGKSFAEIIGNQSRSVGELRYADLASFAEVTRLALKNSEIEALASEVEERLTLKEAFVKAAEYTELRERYAKTITRIQPTPLLRSGRS